MFAKLKPKIFELMENDDLVMARVIDIFLLVLILLNVIMVVLESVSSLDDRFGPFFVEFEVAARAVLPRAVAVALKDVQIFPYRSNDVTIWGTPLGQGSVDFDSILPLMEELLPELDKTTMCVKLRLPPGSTEHAAWMKTSLENIRAHEAFAGRLR